MQDENSTPPSATPADIDTLIPPPWPTWRRGIVAAALVALVIGLTMLATGGWLAPRLEASPAMWGGDDPVFIGYTLENTGSRSVTIESVESIDGLDLRSATLGDVALPAVLHPGTSAQLVAEYTVSSCDDLEADVDGWDVAIRFADGPLSGAQIFRISTDVMERSDGDARGWPVVIADGVCG